MASWSAPPLRSAFANTAAAGATDAAAEAAGGGADAIGTGRPATARTAVPVPTEASPRRHDSAKGCQARRARARARRRQQRGGVGGRAGGPGGPGGAGALGADLLAGPRESGHPSGRAAQAAPGVSPTRRAFQELALPLPPPPDLGRCFGKCRGGPSDAPSAKLQ